MKDTYLLLVELFFFVFLVSSVGKKCSFFLSPPNPERRLGMSAMLDSCLVPRGCQLIPFPVSSLVLLSSRIALLSCHVSANGHFLLTFATVCQYIWLRDSVLVFVVGGGGVFVCVCCCCCCYCGGGGHRRRHRRRRAAAAAGFMLVCCCYCCCFQGVSINHTERSTIPASRPIMRF